MKGVGGKERLRKDNTEAFFSRGKIGGRQRILTAKGEEKGWKEKKGGRKESGT